MFEPNKLNTATLGLQYDCITNALTAKKLKQHISNGADLNAECYMGDSPLFIIIDSYKDILRNELLEIMLSNGANVNWRNCLGQTALHKAKTGDVVKILLSHGAKITNDFTGESVLNEIDDGRAVHLLANAGADINARCKSIGNLTPLMANQKPDVIAALIECGASVNAVSDSKSSALDYHLNNPEIIKILLSHGAIVRPDSPLALLAQDKELHKMVIKNIKKQGA